MADNGTKQRPLRKLTVKNFSVIKEAELEFGKITVLIGPQASGKSLLCKLAYFLGKELVEQTVTSIVQGAEWEEFLRNAQSAFAVRFALESSTLQNSIQVIFVSHEYRVEFGSEGNSAAPSVRFSPEYERTYREHIVAYHQHAPSASGAFIPGGLSKPARIEDVWIALNRVLFGSDLRGTFYAPAGRAFFADFTKGLVLAQNVAIDPITRDFAGQLLWDGDWKRGLLTTGRGVTDEISRQMTNIAKGFVMIDAGTPRFLTTEGRKLPLNLLSTGVQELIPLFNILEQLIYFREHGVETAKAASDSQQTKIVSKPLLYLEEPEANVFPKTQYELVKLFTRLASDPVLDFDWVITTHSPYILSAFNNLIYAGQLGQDKRLKKKIKIDERFWVEPGSFRAYSIHDGRSEPILSDSGLINGDYLDGVSEAIGNEFNDLLRLEYGKKKAS